MVGLRWYFQIRGSDVSIACLVRFTRPKLVSLLFPTFPAERHFRRRTLFAFLSKHFESFTIRDFITRRKNYWNLPNYWHEKCDVYFKRLHLMQSLKILKNNYWCMKHPVLKINFFLKTKKNDSGELWIFWKILLEKFNFSYIFFPENFNFFV